MPLATVGAAYSQSHHLQKTGKIMPDLELLEIEEKSVREVVWRLTSRGMSAASLVINNVCNLACEHCYIYEPERKTGIPSRNFRELSPKVFNRDTAVEIVKDLNGLVYLITIPAMEPFLNQGSTSMALEIAEKANQRGAVSIITNATNAPALLDNEKITSLTQNVEFLSVSLEGDRAIHDKIRGESNFNRTIKGIEHLINLGYPGERITLQTCIQPSLQDPYRQVTSTLEIADEMRIGKASFTAHISPQLSLRPEKKDVLMHQQIFFEILRALKDSEQKGIKNKLVSLYETYESPSAVVALNKEISRLREMSPNTNMEFNAFETSYYIKHPQFRKLDVRLEVAPLTIEIPCYPRITTARTSNLINIIDNDKPIYQGAHITRCFAYQTDEPQIADWIPGLFQYFERRLLEDEHNLVRSLQIPNQYELINVDPSIPRTKEEYKEEVFHQSIRYNLQKTAILKQVYNSLIN